MKKTLLGTTALVAATALAGPAFAADPMTVTVGGFATAAFYYVDSNVGTEQSSVVKWDSEISFTAETTLDNGVTVGAVIELEGATQTSTAGTGSYGQIDHHYVYLSGGFGEINLGATYGPQLNMHYSAPWLGADGGEFHNLFQLVTTGTTATVMGVSTSTYSTIAFAANKIAYYTPRMGGFQLGASYTPDVATVSLNGNSGQFGVLFKDDGLEDIWGFGANYVNSFNGVDVGLSGAYEEGDDNSSSTTADPSHWDIGASIGAAGFTVGGSYAENDNVGSVAGADDQAWIIGADYWTGPWQIGATFFNGDENTTAGGRELDYYKAAANYDMGGGVVAGLHVDYIDLSGVVSAQAPVQKTLSIGLLISTYF